MGLDPTDHDALARLPAAPALGEHGVGFAHARRRPQVGAHRPSSCHRPVERERGEISIEPVPARRGRRGRGHRRFNVVVALGVELVQSSGRGGRGLRSKAWHLLS